MKRFLYGLACLCGLLLAGAMIAAVPAVTVYAENDFTVTEMEGTAVIRAEALNIRSGPGKEYDVIGKAKAGEEFTVSGQTDNGWYRIAYSDKEGYVSGEYAEVTLSGKGGQNGVVDIPDEEKAPIPGIGGVWQKIKAGGVLSMIALILIPIVLVAIGFTVKSMRREDDWDEEYTEIEAFPEDEEYTEMGDSPEMGDSLESGAFPEDGDSSENGEEYIGDDADSEVEEMLIRSESKAAEEPEDMDLSEERNREAFLSREVAPFIEEEAALRAAAKELEAKKEKQAGMQDDESDAELKRAMEKLAELQEEIERIKQKKQ